MKKILEFLGLGKSIDEIHIRRQVFEKITEFARTTYPNEFLAFFEGEAKGNALVVEDLLFQPYVADTDSALPQIDFPTTSKVIGSVHSHPGRGNRPSRSDLHFFQKTGIVHAIIGNPYRKEDLALYDLHGNRIEYREID